MNNDPDHHMWYASIHLHSTHTAPYKYLTKNENKIISQEIKKKKTQFPYQDVKLVLVFRDVEVYYD